MATVRVFRNNNHTTANRANPHGMTWQPSLQQARLEDSDSGVLARYAHGFTRFVRLLKEDLQGDLRRTCSRAHHPAATLGFVTARGM